MTDQVAVQAPTRSLVFAGNLVVSCSGHFDRTVPPACLIECGYFCKHCCKNRAHVFSEHCDHFQRTLRKHRLCLYLHASTLLSQEHVRLSCHGQPCERFGIDRRFQRRNQNSPNQVILQVILEMRGSILSCKSGGQCRSDSIARTAPTCIFTREQRKVILEFSNEFRRTSLFHRRQTRVKGTL